MSSYRCEKLISTHKIECRVIHDYASITNRNLGYMSIEGFT